MDYYDTIAKSYKELYQEEQEQKIKQILKEISIKKTDTIADVGGGPCFLATCIDNTIINIDTSEELLKQSKATRNICASMENIPVENNSVDIVLCISAIHHAKNPEKAIREIKRIGKHSAAITVLNRIPKHDQLLKLIEKECTVKKIIKNKHDDIVIIELNNQQREIQ